MKWKPACFSRCTKIPKRFQCCLIRPAITQKVRPVFKQCMQLCSSWNITLRMLQSYCPNSVIILLSFLWLQSVLQSSKQTFELWSYGDQFSIIRSIRAYNHYLSVLSSLLHSRLSVVTQRSFHWKQLCSSAKITFYDVALVYCVFYSQTRSSVPPEIILMDRLFQSSTR